MPLNEIENNAVGAPELLRMARKFLKDAAGDKIDLSSLPEVRIAVVGSYSTQHITLVLKYLLYLKGFKAEIYEGDYNSINTEILDVNSALYIFKPEYVIILPYYTDIKNFPPLLGDDAAVNQALEENLNYFSQIWKNLRLIKGIQILQANIVIPNFRQLGNFEGNVIYSRENFLRLINLNFIKTKPGNVIIIDLEYIASDVGKNNWFDYTGYFLNKSGFHINHVGRTALCFANMIGIGKGKIRKCLVLDLDNTLWGGVVGDEGPLGIQLDPHNAIGEAYRFFQKYLLSLKECGVILAVCSKNDEAIAKQPFFENKDMILKYEDISCFIANWNDKAENIRRIADELNIGIDSLVFFDDNPAERAIVSRLVPEVLVVDVPEDPALYVPALSNINAFDRFMLTKEDIARTATYQKNNERKRFETSFSDYYEYLKYLEMEAKTGFVSKDERQRFVQLINKTNPFNLRTRRYTDSWIDELENNKDYKLLFIELRDRFDNYGIISCIILKINKDECFIDTWVMSCRVLKRQVEDLAFNLIIKQAKLCGCRYIEGEYIPTEKNKMVSHLFDDFGFTLIENGETKKYSLLLSDDSDNREKTNFYIKQAEV
jgi:FkbH-like protein